MRLGNGNITPQFLTQQPQEPTSRLFHSRVFQCILGQSTYSNHSPFFHPPTIDDGPRKGPYLSIGGGGFLSIVPVPHRIQKNLLGPIYSLPLHRKAPTILWATICMNIFGFNSGPPSRKCLGAGCESRNTRLRFTVSPKAVAGPLSGACSSSKSIGFFGRHQELTTAVALANSRASSTTIGRKVAV